MDINDDTEMLIAHRHKLALVLETGVWPDGVPNPDPVFTKLAYEVAHEMLQWGCPISHGEYVDLVWERARKENV